VRPTASLALAAGAKTPAPAAVMTCSGRPANGQRCLLSEAQGPEHDEPSPSRTWSAPGADSLDTSTALAWRAASATNSRRPPPPPPTPPPPLPPPTTPPPSGSIPEGGVGSATAVQAQAYHRFQENRSSPASTPPRRTPVATCSLTELTHGRPAASGPSSGTRRRGHQESAIPRTATSTGGRAPRGRDHVPAATGEAPASRLPGCPVQRTEEDALGPAATRRSEGQLRPAPGRGGQEGRGDVQGASSAQESRRRRRSRVVPDPLNFASCRRHGQRFLADWTVSRPGSGHGDDPSATTHLGERPGTLRPRAPWARQERRSWPMTPTVTTCGDIPHPTVLDPCSQDQPAARGGRCWRPHEIPVADEPKEEQRKNLPSGLETLFAGQAGQGSPARHLTTSMPAGACP